LAVARINASPGRVETVDYRSQPPGGPYAGEKIEVSIDGVRVALMDINPRMNEQDPNGLTMQTPKVNIKAGQHTVYWGESLYLGHPKFEGFEVILSERKSSAAA